MSALIHNLRKDNALKVWNFTVKICPSARTCFGRLPLVHCDNTIWDSIINNMMKVALWELMEIASTDHGKPPLDVYYNQETAEIGLTSNDRFEKVL